MNRTRAVSLALLASLSLSFAACTTSDSHGDVEDRPSVPLPLGAVTLKGEPGVFGYTVTVAIASDLTTFNPYYQLESSTAEVLKGLYAPLVGFNPVTGEVVPQEGLAAAFEVGGNTVTIRMRDGLRFSDGSEITAEDVVYSFSVALDPDVRSPLADMLAVSGRLPEVEKVDDKTVRLTFADDFPGVGYVLSRMVVISDGDDFKTRMSKGRFEEALGAKAPPEAIACSGPFRVASYEPGKSIDLKYNPNYWRVDSQGRRLPYIDHLVFNFGLPTEAYGS